MTVAGIYALLVIGYQFVFGHAGALSLAQGTFFGLGAYVTGILGSRFDWGFAATFPLSLVLPVLLAALVAAPVLRLQSHYFALATLGIGQVMLLVAVNWQDVTGGANGIPGVPGIVLFGAALPRGLPLLAVVWGFTALGGLERLRERLFPAPPPQAPRATAPKPRPDKGETGPVLEIAGLTKRFGGIEALAGVDLSLGRGEILGLIGPNGSGKTTLVNCIAGLYPADAGTIRFRRASIDALPPHAIALRGIARSFHTGNLVADMTALDAVAMARCAVSGGVSLRRALATPGRDHALDAARGEAMHYLTLLGAAAVSVQPFGSPPPRAARRGEIARALAFAPPL